MPGTHSRICHVSLSSFLKLRSNKLHLLKSKLIYSVALLKFPIAKHESCAAPERPLQPVVNSAFTVHEKIFSHICGRASIPEGNYREFLEKKKPPALHLGMMFIIH